MFSVQLTFKMDGREVELDRFAETLVAWALESVRQEFRTLRVPLDTVVMPTVVGAPEKAQPTAVSVDRAAELLSVSHTRFETILRNDGSLAVRCWSQQIASHNQEFLHY